MRLPLFVFGLALALAACAAPGAGPAATTTLTSANAATALLAGPGLRMSVTTHAAHQDGMDPLITLTLTHEDGRSLRFQEANHAPYDVMAQAPGGPLAQVMGFFGDEAPTYYHRVEGGAGAPFICGAEGPVALGVHEAADGEVSIVALRQTFTYETLADGTEAALPMSPEQVCARMTFRRS